MGRKGPEALQKKSSDPETTERSKMAALVEAPALADSTNKLAVEAEGGARPAKRKAADDAAGEEAAHEDGGECEGGEEGGASKGGGAWTGGAKWAKHGMGDPGSLAFVPKVPPRAAGKLVKLSMYQQELLNSGGHLEQSDYCPKDTILWPPMCADLYREKCRTQDKRFGSRFMRYWFEEHHGMPVEPPTTPKTAYTLFTVDRKREISKERAFVQKKDMKAIGAEWTALSDDSEIRAKYEARIAVVREEAAKAQEQWQAALATWREAKRARVAAESAGPEGRKNPVCACKLCVGDAEEGGERQHHHPSN